MFLQNLKDFLDGAKLEKLTLLGEDLPKAFTSPPKGSRESFRAKCARLQEAVDAVNSMREIAWEFGIPVNDKYTYECKTKTLLVNILLATILATAAGAMFRFMFMFPLAAVALVALIVEILFNLLICYGDNLSHPNVLCLPTRKNFKKLAQDALWYREQAFQENTIIRQAELPCLRQYLNLLPMTRALGGKIMVCFDTDNDPGKRMMVEFWLPENLPEKERIKGRLCLLPNFHSLIYGSTTKALLKVAESTYEACATTRTNIDTQRAELTKLINNPSQ